jgi:antitoxin MazE
MRKKLTAIGNSLGIVIEKPILELLDIDRDTELDMRTDGDRLVLVPIRKGRKQRLKAAMDGETFRKLAK